MTPRPVPEINQEVSFKLASRIRNLASRRLPQSCKYHLRPVADWFLDTTDLLLGRRKPLVPPRHLNFVGDGDFEAAGDEFYRYFIELGGLKPQHRVLDLGCGIGRMARPLTKYLTTGSYDGLDIVSAGIVWCQRSYSQTYPNFHFQLADVQNPAYNPRGRFQPAQYRLPFGDQEFDFVFLTSVFTHMLPAGMANYLSEISRTLRPDGKALITYFLLNDEAHDLTSKGLSARNFNFALEDCRVQNARIPEEAVAYEEKYVRDLLSRAGFEVEGIHYGSWSGRTRHLSYQDLVVVRKKRLP